MVAKLCVINCRAAEVVAAGLQGNGERMRKWTENEEILRVNLSLHFLILSPFPLHFLILSLITRSPAARLQRVGGTGSVWGSTG